MTRPDNENMSNKIHRRKRKENQTRPYGLHASFLPLVGLPLAVPLPEKLKREKGDYKTYPNAHISLVIPKDARISLVTPKDTAISLVIPKDARISLVFPKDSPISLVIPKDACISLVFPNDTHISKRRIFGRSTAVMIRGLEEFDDRLYFNAAEGGGASTDTIGRRTHGGVRLCKIERGGCAVERQAGYRARKEEEENEAAGGEGAVARELGF
ncbi:NBS-LRR type resistance protein [Cucumis melo var. makuwa]|uniref:NBS-LRR type resistance protein n=1 Tax=Cucumis melo var. makuwa TaxID=1194695 RepID=A0A5A7T4T4_CUCMM|nr:NBS-LRR type resistance protein [Cucumis melo var. makuwa]TYK22633.1 NBS-LRR type resistance protein [Cucumis melo var. makuwa]